MDELYRHIVQILFPDGKGSGIIYYPVDSLNCIILSAGHVLDKGPENKYVIRQITQPGGALAFYKLDPANGDRIQLAQDCDLGLILLDRKKLIHITGELAPLKCLDRQFDFQNCLSLGYPDLNKDKIIGLRSRFRSFSEIPNNVIESNTTDLEDLKTLRSESQDAVHGMSGGALFFNTNTEYYLAGLLTDYKNEYKDFLAIGLSKVNEFLTSLDLPSLPITYGTRSGLNEDWFITHLHKARKDLGERYTSEIDSLDVPQMRFFKSLALNEAFRSEIKAVYHDLIIQINKQYSLRVQTTQDFADKLNQFVNEVRQQYKDTTWEIGQYDKTSIPIKKLEAILSELDKCQEKVREEQHRIYREREEERKRKSGGNEDSTLSRYMPEPLGSQRHALQETSRALQKFRNFLYSSFFNLSLTPNLIVTGAAGHGKSHMLGDIAMRRLENGKPTILVLGNQMMSTEDPRIQIMRLLGLPCSFSELLAGLDVIGRVLGERVLFMIDALNEGQGKMFWKNFVEGFIQDFTRYPFVGLVMSARTTYLNDVLTKGLEKSDIVIQIEHRGFQGMELEAVRHFCKCFGLNEPGVPLLAPEFTNPQFLLLTCKSLKAQGVSNFPKGLFGISEIYQNHTQDLSDKLRSERGYEVPEHFDFVQEAIKYLLQHGDGPYKITDAMNFFIHYPYVDGRKLFHDLIRCNVLTEEKVYFGKDHGMLDAVRFSYERFADQMFIKSLLENCSDNPESLKNKGEYIHELLTQQHWKAQGKLAALAIQLPEKFGLEIYELIDKDFLRLLGAEKEYGKSLVEQAWINSLLWRKKASIDEQKGHEYIEKSVLCGNLIHSDLFEKLVTLASFEDHPFNADYIHEYLTKFNMPERDSFWIEYTYEQFGQENSPISRLITWVLDYDEHQKLSQESRQLCCIILTWLLGSPFIPLRDAATIAILKLLDGHLENCIPLMERFINVTDLYLQERLASIVYGAILRSNDNAQVHEIAEYVFKRFFASSQLTVHIMLRDYLRSIVEYASYLDPDLGLDMNLAKPPYESTLPEKVPSEDDIKKHSIEWSKEFSYLEKMSYQGNQGVFEISTGYTFEKSSLNYSIERFYSLGDEHEQQYLSFRQSLSKVKKRYLDALVELIHRMDAVQHSRKLIDTSDLFDDTFGKDNADVEDSLINPNIEGEKEQDVLLQSLNQKFTNLEERLKDFLDKTEREVYEKVVPAYIEIVRQHANDWLKRPVAKRYGPWLVQRIYELGFDDNSHGRFDSIFYDRLGKIEHDKYQGHLLRISEKYQSIAGNELLARFADNYFVTKNWEYDHVHRFRHPRFGIVFPDIDPTFATYHPKDFQRPTVPDYLFFPYNNWHLESWIEQDDWPMPSELLSFVENGFEWIQLTCWRSWKEEIEVGKEMYRADQKEVNLWGHGILVKREQLGKVINHLSKRQYSALLPEIRKLHNVFYREFYWSYLYQLEQRFAIEEERGACVRFFGSDLEIHIPVEIYDMHTTFQQNSYTLKPSQLIFRALNLSHSKFDGLFENLDGTIVAKALDGLYLGFAVRKDVLLDYLNSNSLCMVYVWKGEKCDRYHKDNGEVDHVKNRFIIGETCLNEDGSLTDDCR